MPLKVSLGVSEKVGQPDYGSLGASCHVDLELDASLIQNDLETFHRHVRNAYVACRQAVNDELARNKDGSATSPHVDNGHSQGTGRRNEYQASDKQLNYARRLASQIQGLGRIDDLVTRMFDKPVSDLSSFEASSVIDQLKSIKDGTIRLDDIIVGAPV